MEAREEGAAAATRHVYPTSAMVGDYLRSAAGLVPALLLVVLVRVGDAVLIAAAGFAAIFAIFGVRAVLRHRTRLEMTETGLRAHGVRHQAVAWSDLDRMKLAYYSTRRDRQNGWMQLQLSAGRVRLDLDSRIAGFDRLVRRAAEAAAARGLALSDATIANLRSLGVKSWEPGAE